MTSAQDGPHMGDGRSSFRPRARSCAACPPGLLERFEGSLVETVEAIGAMQGQAWAALPVGLWSRMSSFTPADLYGALEREELLWGIGIRGTLHLVSAREHPAYAVVAVEPTGSWHRAGKQTTPGMDALREDVLAFAKGQPRTNDEIGRFAEDWVAGHPGEIEQREVEAQRSLKWRPIYRWSALVRVPAGGTWGTKTPCGSPSRAHPAGQARGAESQAGAGRGRARASARVRSGGRGGRGLLDGRSRAGGAGAARRHG